MAARFGTPRPAAATPANTLNRAPGWTKVSDHGKQRTKATATEPAATTTTRSELARAPNTRATKAIPTAAAPVASTAAGAKEETKATRRPRLIDSKTVERDRTAAPSLANGDSPVALARRTRIQGMAP